MISTSRSDQRFVSIFMFAPLSRVPSLTVTDETERRIYGEKTKTFKCMIERLVLDVFRVKGVKG